MRDYKVVVLGSGGVGKSSLTVQFVQGVYIDSYDPTIEDSYRKQIEVDGRACDLEILDTAGVAQFTAMRELYIKSGRGFLLVYSVTEKYSLQELLELREQVLRIKDSANVPMVLIGNKCDLSEERVLKPEDGIQVSEKWGCVPFYETSAMHKTNVDEAFIDVVRQIMRNETLESQLNSQPQQEQTIPTQTNKTPQQQQSKQQSKQQLNKKSSSVKDEAKSLGKMASSAAKAPKKKKKSSCIIL